MKRIEWVDYGKSIAIFLVVLLHVNCDMDLDGIINAFIMPLFFVISGRLFSYRRNPDYSRFAKKRFRQIIVPYLWIGALSYVFWLLASNCYGDDSNTMWYVPLVGLFAGIPKYGLHNIPLWSFLSFFVVEMAYYPFGRRKWSRRFVPVCGVFLLWTMYVAFPDSLSNLPFALGPSIAGIVFYALGHAWRRHPEADRYVFAWWAIPVWIGLFYAGWNFNGNVKFYLCEYTYFGLFLLTSLSGSVIIIWLSMQAARLGSNGFIRFVSCTTLLICGFHLMTFACMKGAALTLFGIQPEILTRGLLRGVLFAAAGFLLTLLPSLLIVRKLDFLVDKKA